MNWYSKNEANVMSEHGKTDDWSNQCSKMCCIEIDVISGFLDLDKIYITYKLLEVLYGVWIKINIMGSVQLHQWCNSECLVNITCFASYYMKVGQVCNVNG